MYGRLVVRSADRDVFVIIRIIDGFTHITESTIDLVRDVQNSNFILVRFHSVFEKIGFSSE